MTKSRMALALGLATGFLLSGCLGGGDSSNANPDPSISTPGRIDLSQQVSAPSPYLPVKSLTAEYATALVQNFLAYGMSFANPGDVSEYFLGSGSGTFNGSLQPGDLGVVASYNPYTGNYLSALSGFASENIDTLPPVVITGFSDAVYDQITQLSPDPQNGLLDEYQRLDFPALMLDAGENQLILEGNTPSTAEAAHSSEKLAAYTRLMDSSVEAQEQAGEVLSAILQITLWLSSESASPEMELEFIDGDTVAYTNISSGTTEEGSYSVSWSSPNHEIVMELPDSGTQVIDLGLMIEGYNILNFMGQDLMPIR